MILFFRSEEHIARWRKQKRMPEGETLPLQKAWQLAVAWYQDRGDPKWRRKTAEESKAVFRSIGLLSSFWQEF